MHRGLGKSLAFVRALAKIRPSEAVEITGFYAKNWPQYLEKEMGVRVVDERLLDGKATPYALRSFQAGTEGLKP